MSDTKYTYAVARIRALEVSLFSSSTIEQLIACKDMESCLRFLSEHGWGGVDTAMDADAILTREQEKIWETIGEMQVDMNVFDVLSYPNWFHNLKAAVKEVCTGRSGANIYFEGTPIPKDEMIRIVREKDFQALPENMREAAREAVDTLLHSGDGQLCDVMIDRAALEAILEAGNRSKAAIIRDYAESTVAVANIKIAVRCCKTGKSLEFMKRAMAPCKTLNVERLAHAALAGMDSISINEAGISLAFVPEDRIGMGLVGDMDMTDNMMLRSYRNGKSPFLDRKGPRALAQKIKDQLEVMTPSISAPVRQMSGGNVQKVLVGREIAQNPKVLLVAFPTRGVDINTSHVIYQLLNEQKKKGVAVVCVIEDLDVVLELCDRIAVLCGGRISGVVDGRTATKEGIGLLMTKHEKGGRSEERRVGKECRSRWSPYH